MAREPFGLAGQLIDGQFRVEAPIGEGGFSVVYRGMHTGLNEPIAIKCLKLTTTLDGESIENFTRRFRDEGRLLYRLGQGNLDIVRCIMSGTTVSPLSGALVPYMVLEWLDGRSVAADLKHRRTLKLRGRSLEEMVTLFEPGATALEYAHRQGVVHRDVKPANLFLVDNKATGRTRMKVLDFGLAKILDETVGITLAATVGSFMMCSPRYAAPEQFDPKIGPIGPWTDVYSLALLILEVLRDKKVRGGDGLVGCMAEAIDPKNDLSARALGMELPPRIEAALAKAVSIDTRRRQRSAGELWDEIRAATRERTSMPWGAAPPVGAGGAPSTQSPSTLGDTIVDPVFSVPLSTDGLGGTLMMSEAPAHPVVPSVPPGYTSPRAMQNAPQGYTSQPVISSSPSGRSSQPVRMSPPPLPPGSLPPSGRNTQPPSGNVPVLHSPVPPSRASARRGSRAPLVIFLLVALAVVGAGSFFGWRAWKAGALPMHLQAP